MGVWHTAPVCSWWLTGAVEPGRSSRAKRVITRRLPTPLRLLKVRTSPCTHRGSPGRKGQLSRRAWEASTLSRSSVPESRGTERGNTS